MLKNTRNFTLIELLVTITVIAILAAILLPVLSKAKRKASNAVCMNNLHQQGLAMMMYASDNDSHYYWRYDGAAVGQYYMPRQMSRESAFDSHLQVETYLPVSDLYLCPFNMTKYSAKDIWPRVDTTAQNNGFQFWTYNIFANYASSGNIYYTKEGNPRPWYDVVPQKEGEADKDQLPLMGDQMTENPSAGGFWNAHVKLPSGTVPVNMLAGNSLYADGRVEHHSAGDGFVKYFTRNGNLRMWRPGD